MTARAARAALPALLALLGPVACGGGRAVVPDLPGDGDRHTARPGGDRAGAADPWAGRDLVDPPAPLEPAPLALPPLQRFVLGNGLTVIAVESHAAPTIHVQLAVRAGRRHEARDKIGLSSYVASMLPRGAAGRREAQITTTLEQAGAELATNATFEATLITCHAPQAGAAACLGTVAALAARPTFPAAALGAVRDQLAGAARAGQQDPSALATQLLQSTLWGDDHVRAWPLSERSVAAITRADLVRFHRAHFTPRDSVLVVVSPQAPAATRAALQRAFGGWRGPAPRAAAAAPDPAAGGLRVRLLDVPGMAQAQVRVGHLGLAHRDPDFLAATVVNHVLGGPAGRSRLSQAARRLGERVDASSSFDRNLERGAFVVAGTAPSNQAVALMRLAIEQIAAMQARGPTEAEVAAAVRALAGGYQTHFASHQELAGALLAAELHGLGADYVRGFAVNLARVTREAAAACAARRLDGKNLVVVVAGDGQAIEPQLVEAGLRFERVAVNQLVAGPTGPAAAPGKGETPAAPAAPAAPVDPKKQAAARAILEAALAAKGGAERLGRIKAFSWKGTAELNLPAGKVPARVEKRHLLPDRLRLDMTLEMGGAKMDITTALAGDKGWAREQRPGGGRVIDFPASEIDAGKAQIWRDQDFVLLRHRDAGVRLEPLPDETIDGAPHHAIRMTSPDGRWTVTLLVHKKLKRLSGMSYTEQGATAEERFGDYRAVQGLQVAHRRSTRSAQIDLTTTVTAVEIDGKIDPAIFAKPAG